MRQEPLDKARSIVFPVASEVWGKHIILRLDAGGDVHAVCLECLTSELSSARE